MGQDAFFGNMNVSSLFFNPANASHILDHDLEGKVGIKYRDQWSNVTNPTFRTVVMEGEYKIYNSSVDSWHIGFILMNDISNGGILKQNGASIQAAYSRKFTVSRTSFHNITLGSALGINSTNANTMDLWFSRQYDNSKFEIDPTRSSGETSLLDNRSHLSLDLGIRWIYQLNQMTNLQVGLAAHHLNEAEVGLISSTENISRKTLVSLVFERKTKNKILRHRGSIHFLSQGPAIQILPSYGIKLDFPENDNMAIEASIGSRISRSINGYLNDAIIVSFGLLSAKWSAIFSYEANTSGLNYISKSTGALELTMEYYLGSSY